MGCTSRTVSFPGVVVELRRGAQTTCLETCSEEVEPLEAAGVAFVAQVLEEAEGSAGGAVHVAVDALDVELMTVLERVDEGVRRAAHGAVASVKWY